MLKFVVRRLFATLPVLGIVAVLVFMLLRLTPGDPAAMLAGDAANAMQIEHIRRSLGLDQSLMVQFGRWLQHVVQGDLGESFYFKMQVTQLIAQRLEPTLALASLSLCLAVSIAVPLGVFAAWRRDSGFDRVLMGASVLGFSVPVFVLAYVLIWIFSLQLDWLPVQGYESVRNGFWPWLRHLILPALTLSVVYIALIARITRAAVIEVLGEDYIRTARAKGVSEARVLIRHALANAGIPVLTVIGISLALLLSGVVVTESVYAIPGLGRLMVDAVLARDFPTIQGVVLFFSGLYVFLNLVIDMSYVFVDPRIRY